MLFFLLVSIIFLTLILFRLLLVPRPDGLDLTVMFFLILLIAWGLRIIIIKY